MGGKRGLQVTVEQIFRPDAAECWHRAYTLILAHPTRRDTSSPDGRPLPVQQTLSNAPAHPNPVTADLRPSDAPT